MRTTPALFVGGPADGTLRAIEPTHLGSLPGYQTVAQFDPETLAEVVSGRIGEQVALQPRRYQYEHRRLSLFGRTVHAYVLTGMEQAEIDRLTAERLLTPLAHSLMEPVQ